MPKISPDRYIPKGIDFCYYFFCEKNIKTEIAEQQAIFKKIKEDFYEKIKSGLSLERYLELISSHYSNANKKEIVFADYHRGILTDEFFVVCPHCNNTLSYVANELTGTILKTGRPYYKIVANAKRMVSRAPA